MVEVESWLARLARRDDLLTRTFIAMYIAVFTTDLLLEFYFGIPWLRLFGMLHAPSILEDGEWRRLLTATFLHGGILHLFFNCMVLNAIGPVVEQNLGRLRFAVLYLASGVLANTASLYYNVFLYGMDFRQLGASGAIMGLLGAIYVIGFLRGGTYGILLKKVSAQWIVINVVFGLVVAGSGAVLVDNVAHICGALSGGIMARGMGLRRSS